VQQLRHVGPDIASGKRPSCFAAVDQAIQIPRLMRAMECANAEMQYQLRRYRIGV
jgi:hypothetical protein